MSRYYGVIGFAETEETPVGSGIWKEVITERHYFGDVNRNSQSWQNASTLNDNVNISNEIVIVLDAYLSQHVQSIRYVEWMGAYWKVNNILVEHPHLKMTIGGVYNREEQNGTSQ